MDEGHALGARRLGKPDAVLPGGVAVAHMAGHLFVGIGAIVEKQIGTGDEVEHGGIERAGVMLGIGDDGDRATAELDPVAHRAAGMEQLAGPDRHVRIGGEDIAAAEIAGIERSAADIGLHREPGRTHEFADDLPGRHAPGQMARPERDGGMGIEQRRKIGKPDDVVVMAVGEEQVEVGHAFGAQGLPRGHQARAGIEQQPVRTDLHFNADGVAAKLLEVRT